MAIIDEIGRLLGAVKEACRASVVCVIDCDLERLHASSEASERGFWKVLSAMPCLNLEREGWLRALRSGGTVETGCRREVHHTVRSVLIHDRWALVAVHGGSIEPAAVSALLSVVGPLGDLLPLNRMRGQGGRRGGEPSPAELAVPLWWLHRDG